MIRLVWTERSQSQVEAIFVATRPSRRDAMQAIVLKIQADLQAHGPTLGESRSKMARIHYCLPFGLHFWVNDRPDAAGVTTVTIARVWRVKHRRRRR